MLPACLLIGLALPARAQTPKWQLKISEKELQLVHPTDPMWMKSNMWDISFQRMHDRNMPTLELNNLQAAGSPDITKLTLSIGDTRFHFSDDVFGSLIAQCPCSPMAPDDSPAGLTLTPSLSANGNLLTIDLTKSGGGGLAPGEIVRFKIDIDVDEGFDFFPHPDYRTVLFDMNGVEVYGPDPNIPAGQTDNSQGTVMFSDGTTAGPATFADETVPAPQSQFFNETFRAYGIMEPVDTFMISGGPTVIPEPASGVLALAGLIGTLWLTARKRRTASIT
jgi:hypothetical protein